MAAVPPPDVIDHLAAAVGPVQDGAMRWSETDAWHITLAFYGEVAESKLEDLTSRVARAARRHPPVDVSLAGAGRFGSAVVWIGVRGEVTALRRLAQSMAAIGRRIGGRQERRPFRPHVTLARSRTDADLRPYVERLVSYTGPSWTVEEVTLLQSHLGTGHGAGPRYEEMRRFTLTGVRASQPPQR